MPKPLEITTPSDRQVRIVRSFDAPRELVWDCHTRPELVRRWLPSFPGWTMTTCEIDLRVGGTYRYVLKGPDGEEMGFGGTYLEITRPERIRNRERFDEDWTGGETEITNEFAERDGRTTSTMTILYVSKQARDGAMATGMAEGLEGGYRLMDQVLAELNRAA